MGVLSGTRPANLGVTEGRLAPPNARPNNVSTQTDAAKDTEHFVEPLRPRGDPVRAFALLKDIVRGMERVTVVRDEPEYLYVEFRSKTMGFVDDAEFFLDRNTGIIHARAAARLGIRDFGVNRDRVEAVRAALHRAEAR